jgi:flavocytochrome c
MTADTERRENEEHRMERYDVVIIGSGFAGLSAAIEARTAGASVLILEKNLAPGGNSRISEGGIAAAQTDVQQRLKISDSKELFYQDIMKSGLYLNHPELVRILVEQSAEAFAWSRDYLGIRYLDRVDIFGGHSAARCLTAEGISGVPMIERQLERVRSLGADLRTGTAFLAFLRDSDRRVTGVSTEDRQGLKRTVEAGAVVLASGGYGADIPFRSLQNPRLDSSVDSTNLKSATAEALKAALGMGAAPIHLSSIQLGPWTSPDEKGFGHGPRFSDYIVFPYGFAVDSGSGRRFVNELADRKRIADAILSTGQPCIGVADAAAVSLSGWDISKALKTGVVRRFDSLETLAEEYLPSVREEFFETVREYNEGIRAGVDRQFGRPVLADAVPCSTPPYYGIRLWPKVHHVSGGIGISPRTEVIDLNGEPVPGLYAAGEVVGGIHGANRLASCAITECFVFGRIAGRQAAACPR